MALTILGTLMPCAGMLGISDQLAQLACQLLLEALASRRKAVEQRTLLLVLQAFDREPLLLAIGHLTLEPILSPANDDSGLALLECDLVVDLGARRAGCILLVAEVPLLSIAATGERGNGSAHGATAAGHRYVRKRWRSGLELALK